jgi:hypothetical protein
MAVSILGLIFLHSASVASRPGRCSSATADKHRCLENTHRISFVRRERCTKHPLWRS